MSLARNIAKWSGITFVALLGSVVLLFFFAWRAHQIQARVGCPVLAWLIPIDHTPIGSNDYIEITAGGGLTYWEPIHIRIYGDGRVERDTVETIRGFTTGCPLHPDQRTTRVSPQDAKKLLELARDGGFCRLCSVYQYPGIIYDAGSSTMTVSLGGKEKSVRNHAGKPPPILNELYDSIDKLTPMDDLADTHKFSPEREAECSAFLEQQEDNLHSGKGR